MCIFHKELTNFVAQFQFPKIYTQLNQRTANQPRVRVRGNSDSEKKKLKLINKKSKN